MKEIVPQTEGFTEFPRPLHSLHTYTDLKRVLNELNGPKKTTQQRGVYATNHATWSKKAGEFPEIPKRNSSTQALVLVGNKWTADALSEIGVSTQGGNSIEREVPNSWMFFFMVKAKITWMISGYTKMTWETSVYMMITMIYDDYN